MIINIIFDLGGVIIGIDYPKTSDAFKALGGHEIDRVYSQRAQVSLFDEYDRGKISSEIFRKQLKEQLNIENVSDSAFDIAWNAMLLNLPLERLAFIRSLKERYRVFLLSNTNEIHLKEVFNICSRDTRMGQEGFTQCFHRVYYSHEMGLRKPDKEAFEKIIHENGLVRDETLFIDDSEQHVRGALAVGIHAIYLDLTNKKPADLADITIDSLYDLPAAIAKLNDRAAAANATAVPLRTSGPQRS